MNIKQVIVALLVALSINSSVCFAADDIAKITRVDMTISIDESGTAHVKEVWNANVPSGTECSKQLINLNGSEITNLSVEDELGKQYTLMQPWDSSKNRLDKYTSYGMRSGVNGDVTIYWGLGDYGERAYILNYDITNFVKSCADSQYIYSTLLYISNSLIPEKISVRVEFPYDIDSSILNSMKVYGGKYDIAIDTEDSKVLLINSSNYASNPYLVSLIKLPDSSSSAITTSLSTDKTWAEISSEADAGKGLGVVTETISLQQIIILVVIALILILVLFKVLSIIKIRKRLNNPLGLPVKFLYDKNTSPSTISNIESSMPKDILQSKNEQSTIYEIYTVGVEYGIVQNSYSLLGALLMKWIVNSNISISSHKDSFELKFLKEPRGLSFELELYNAMYSSISSLKNDSLPNTTSSSTVKNSMTAKEFSEWFRGWVKGYNIWLDEVMRSVMRSLQDRGYCNTVTVSKRVQHKMNFIEYKVSSKMRDYAEEIQGFKRYIRSELGNSINNISNLNDYIIYAQLFGCTNVLFERLSLLREQGVLQSDSYYASISTKESNNTLILLNKLLSIVAMRLKSQNKKK